MKLTHLAAGVAASAVLVVSAQAADFDLRLQTHYAAESVSGKLA